MKKVLQKPVVFIAAIGVGVVLAALLISLQPSVQRVDAALPSRVVEYIPAELIPFNAVVTAYGSVEPAVLLEAKAEVSGKISYVHPELKQGSSIPIDTLAVRIDPEDYEVSLKQTEAELEASQFMLKQLDEEEKATRRSLALAKKTLAVGEDELERLRQVYEKRVIAKSTLDAEEQKFIQLEQKVAELQGQLNTFASRKKVEEAKIQSYQQAVRSQQTTLGRTEILLPFNARVGDVAIEKGEFVSVGEILFEALDSNGVEINAQLPIRDMRRLVSHMAGANLLQDNSFLDVSKALKALGLKAQVNLVGFDADSGWEARVVRISEAVDPTRRTLGIVVAVDNTYSKIVAGHRPLLLKGMYTSVNIVAPRREAMIVPRSAVHEGRVYVADSNNQLVIKPVEVSFSQGELVVIRSGLTVGDRVIVTDVLPVIEGMPLEPLLASELQGEIARLATSEI